MVLFLVGCILPSVHDSNGSIHALSEVQDVVYNLEKDLRLSIEHPNVVSESCISDHLFDVHGVYTAAHDDYVNGKQDNIDMHLAKAKRIYRMANKCYDIMF